MSEGAFFTGPEPGFRPRIFSRWLRRSYNHFSAYLTKLPWLLERILWFFFSRIELEEKDRRAIKEAAQKGMIIYALPNPSRLEYMFLHLKLKREGLPYPVFSHYLSMTWFQPFAQILRLGAAKLSSLIYRRNLPNPYTEGFVQGLMERRDTTCMFLRQFQGLPKRFFGDRKDPLAEIIPMQQKIDTPVLLVPVVLIYGRTLPRQTSSIVDLFLGTRETPGVLRGLAMFVANFQNAFVRVMEPINLEEIVEQRAEMVSYSRDRMEDIAYEVRKACLERIAAERKLILGPALKPRSEMIETVVRNPDLNRNVLEYCKETGKDFIAARREVRAYAEEIAADMDDGTISLFNRVAVWVFAKIYNGIITDEPGLERVAAVARRMPIIYIPCHKSHMDYILLSYVLYHHKVHLPYIAAGVNLSFWPLGPIFRHSGAFFLRRRFKGLGLYPLAFSKYIQTMLEEGATLEFFVEGGRSRTGKVILPKLGFLSIVLDALRKSGMRDFAFVPISISYEKVLEESIYLREQAGRPNQKENLATVLKNRGLLSRKQGNVYVDFCEPITLREMLKADRLKSIPPDRDMITDLAGKFAYKVVYRINENSRATPYSIVAAAVLSTARQGILFREILERSEMLRQYLVSRKVTFGENIERTSGWIESTLRDMEADQVVSTDKEEAVQEDERVFFLNEEKRLHLCFHKNGVLHHFQFPAMLSIGLLKAAESERREETLLKDFSDLKDVLSLEFVFSEKYPDAPDAAQRQFEEALEYFTGAGLIVRQDGVLLLSRKGEVVSRVYASLISSFIESYYIVARTVRKHGKKRFPERDALRLALKEADRALSIAEISRRESKNKLVFVSAFEFLQAKGIIRIEAEAAESKRPEKVYFLDDTDALDALIALLEGFLVLKD